MHLYNNLLDFHFNYNINYYKIIKPQIKIIYQSHIIIIDLLIINKY